MENYRKEQMKLAVLYEVKPEARKNGDIVTSAEHNFIHDERYQEMMLNGKQTKGRKELQFILYDFKKDSIIETVKRGVFRQGDLAWNTLMEMIYKFKGDIESGKLKQEEVIFTDEMQSRINEIYGDGSPWTPRVIEEKVEAAEDTAETVTEDTTETADTGDNEKTENKHWMDFSVLGDTDNTDNSDSAEVEGSKSLKELLNEEYESGSDRVIYESDYSRVTEDKNGRTKVEFKGLDSETGGDENSDTDNSQVENEGAASDIADVTDNVDGNDNTDSESTADTVDSDNNNDNLDSGCENDTDDCQVVNDNEQSEDPVAGEVENADSPVDDKEISDTGKSKKPIRGKKRNSRKK